MGSRCSEIVLLEEVAVFPLAWKIFLLVSLPEVRPFLQPVKVWMVAQPSRIAAILPNVVSSTNLLRVHSVPSSRT